MGSSAASGRALHARSGGATREPYLRLWIARAWILSAMASQGVQELKGVQGVTMHEFSAAFPDNRFPEGLKGGPPP